MQTTSETFKIVICSNTESRFLPGGFKAFTRSSAERAIGLGSI